MTCRNAFAALEDEEPDVESLDQLDGSNDISYPARTRVGSWGSLAPPPPDETGMSKPSLESAASSSSKCGAKVKKARMCRFTRKSQRARRRQRAEEKIEEMLNNMDEADEEIDEVLNYMDEEGMPEEEGEETMFAMGDAPVKTSMVMDSGAAEHVASRLMAPHGPIRPSAGSRRGQRYVAANGCRMANEGEQTLEVVTEDGGAADMTFQITQVKKPLCSVARLCDRGNRVTFGRSGGVIHNIKTDRVTPFRRRGEYTQWTWYSDLPAVRLPMTPRFLPGGDDE